MGKFGTARSHASISKHCTVASSSSVLWYCSLAKPDYRTKVIVQLHETMVMELPSCMAKNVIAGISVRSSVPLSLHR